MIDGLTLLASEQIVDSGGRPTLAFQKKWQELTKRLKAAEQAISTLETTVADIPNLYVAKDTVTNWAAWTGTADRATHATYTAVTISNPPTQAEVQAISTALQQVSRGFKAKLDDDIASGVNK